MDEQTKKAKWEVVSLAKEIFAKNFILNPLNENMAAITANWSIRAAEIFYEELAKKEGAT